MFSKKIALLGSLAILGLPLSTFADLTTNNYTNEPNTVKILNGSLPVCSSIIANIGITQPHEMNHHIPQNSINILCKGTGNECIANLYASNNCSGDAVAKAKLTKGGGASVIDSSHPRYVVTASGSTVSINYRG